MGNSSSKNSSRIEGPANSTRKEALIPPISGCTLYFVSEGQVSELVKGDFTITCESDSDTRKLANIVKVGNQKDNLKWPLTKDEPVVKLDMQHYLFSLPLKGGSPLSYGVTFPDHKNADDADTLRKLDKFLQENSCFSCASSSATYMNKDVKWEDFAPGVQEYHNALANIIDQKTDQLVSMFLHISSEYSNKIVSHGLARQDGVKSQISTDASKNKRLIQNLQRARKLSEKLDNITKAPGKLIEDGKQAIMKPVLETNVAQKILETPPAEIIIGTLDAINKIMDGLEAAGTQALSATKYAASDKVSERYGETAGTATNEVLSTAGHSVSAGWNILQLWKKLNPANWFKSKRRGSAGKVKKTAKTTEKMDLKNASVS